MGRPKKEKPTHSSGMYRYCKTVGHNFDGSPIKKVFYSKKSKADAKRIADEYEVSELVKQATGEAIIESRENFENWAKQWLKTMKSGSVKEHTYKFTYESNVRKYLIPFFGKAKLKDIKQIDIQRYFNTVSNGGKPLAKSTLDKHKMILKSIFDSAIDNDIVYKNPVKSISYPHFADTKTKNVYTKEQATKVKEYCEDKKYYDIFVMLETGIRRSELLGLEWSDIDFSKKYIHIQRGVTQTTGKIVIGDTKTKGSNRYIPISEKMVEIFCNIKNGNIFVFGTDKPTSPNSYSKSFAKKMKEISTAISVPELTPHELRHTYGTILRESGVDIYTIQKVMGHSDISVTASVYVHNDLEVLRKKLGVE